MKFMHLSDLHLGKKVNEFSMIEDQKYILKQILSIASKESVDGILIAGDIYDKSIPTVESVNLFDSFLNEIKSINVPVYMISGNHDSAERLAFGKRLFEHNKIYISTVYDGQIKPYILSDEYGEIAIYLMPFVKPVMVRPFYDDEIHTTQEAIARILQDVKLDKSKRNIILAHQFVTGALQSESEEVSIGGLDEISVEIFKDFDYVALGHIHRPQKLKSPYIRYSGSPLKYSLSEANYTKSVPIITFKEKGTIELDLHELKPLHELRKVEGSYDEISHMHQIDDKMKSDYLFITLTDEKPVIGAYQKLNTVCKHIMKLEYQKKLTVTHAQSLASDLKSKTPLELFGDFYYSQTDTKMTEKQTDYVKKLMLENDGGKI